MIRIICCVLILAVYPTRQSEAIERSMGNLDIRIVAVTPSGVIKVEMAAKKSHGVRVWRESNSWGAARWRVLVVRDGHVSAFVQDPDQIFTRNLPGFIEISGSAQFSLDPAKSTWLSSAGRSFNVKGGDVIIAIYDVPASKEARDMNVWYGTVVATSTMSRN